MFGAFVTQKLEATQEREEKTLWHRVGTAFKHKQGDGYNIELYPGVSVSGKLIIIPIDKNSGSSSNESTQTYNLDHLPDNKE
ncbi:hypothetical protein NL493_25620 [Klebsiella pneumoniae]|nr:hypothetical protein [Klebsiella pneumoniae]